VKKKIAVSLSCLVIIVVASMALVASGTNKFAFSPDLRTVKANSVPAHIIPALAEKTKGKPIKGAGNFSKDKSAVYFSIFGNTIDQGVNGYPFLIWQGNAFTPTVSATATEVSVGLGDLDSGHGSIQLSLYADNGGIPGTQLATGTATNVEDYGTCCGATTATMTPSVSLTAGTQYWVVVSTTAQETDIYGWNFNTTNMTAEPAAEFCQGSSTYCGNNSGVWVPYSYVQNAFQVLGN
jgi:hypothetical protein